MRYWQSIADADALHSRLGGDGMGGAELPLAACAIAVALLAGASSAVAAADDLDSGGTDSSSISDSGSGNDHTDANTYGDAHTDANTYGSDADARTPGDQSGDTPDTGDTRDTGDTGDAGDTGNAEERGGEKKPDDDDSGNNDRDKTINRMPVLIPEAPPPADFAPLPEELPPPPLEPVPPPVDLPPVVPNAPLEPDPVDVMSVGSGAGLDGHEPPVVTVPLIVPPVLAPPGHILGASLAPRATSRVGAVTPASGWAGEPAPSMRQPANSEPRLGEPRLGEPPSATVGWTGRGQLPNRSGYNNDKNLPHSRLSAIAASALPGVAGMVIMTASGICLGYRQAMAGQQLGTFGADRFLA
jgi:hypothetical protein